MGDTPKQPALRATGDEESILQEISILLRDGRLDAGESIEEVARALRINRRYLEAIEEGRFSELPGPVYTLGFIRSFGDHVGLNGEDLVRRYKSVSSETGKRAELDFPEPIPESGLPGGAVLFAGLVVAGLAYGGWYVLSEDDSLLSDLVAPVPEQLAQKSDQEEPVSVQDPLVTIQQEPAVVVGESDVAPAAEEAAQQAEDATASADTAAEEATTEVAEGAADDAAGATDSATGMTNMAETGEQAAAEAVDTAASGATAEEPAVEAAVEQPQPEAVAAPEPSADAEPVAEQSESVAEALQEPAADSSVETAADLNEDQLRAIQTGMIDAPMPEPVAEPAAEPVAEPEPEAVAETASAIEEAASEPAAEPEPAPEPEAAAEPAAEPETAATAETEPAAEEPAAEQPVAEEPVAEEPATASEPEVAAIPEEEVIRVTIRARENSWVEVTDSETGEIMYSQLMRAGDRYNVPNRSGLVLQTGNAGALEIIVDGDAAPKIGHGGQVARNVSLDADLLKAGTADQ